MHPLVKRYKDETGWKDKCLLLELIHIKMRQQSLTKQRKWRIKDTAKMLELSIGLVSEDLQIAKAISSNAIDSKVISRNQAIKLIRERK
jgi:hypothetical protein